MVTATRQAPPGEARGSPPLVEGPSQWEIRFRLDSRNQRVELPPRCWTDVRLENDVVVVRTFAPVLVLHTLCCSAREHGVDLPDLEVRPGPG